jgi:hypothetical protein
MRLTRNHSIKGIFIFFASLLTLLFVQSLAHSQWTSVTPPTITGDWNLLDVHFTSANEGWAVGWDDTNDRGVLLHYQTGIWTSINPPDGTYGLTGIHFTSANEGWAVGINPVGQGVLLHYQNGIWSSVTPPTVGSSWQLFKVHFTSPDEGWAVGLYGGFSLALHYQNGIWSVAFPPGFRDLLYLFGIHFTSANEGWAVGEDSPNTRGLLLHYKDGIWTSVTPPTVGADWELADVHFTSANEGWAVGLVSYVGIGALLHYQNEIWTSVTPPTVSTHWQINGVHFTSPDEGWAVGWDNINKRGVLLHHQKGRWTSVTPPEVSESWTVWRAHFISAGEGWAVGYDNINKRGVLLYYHLTLSNYEGTLGTNITLDGSGFGAKKGKVLIGGVSTKIAKDGWKSDSITCTVTKVPPVGTHEVTIKPYKADDIIISNAFTVKAPEIDSLNSYIGTGGITPIIITGRFFSTKKGKVYLEYEKDNKPMKKNCKVTSWGMDSISFIVPKTSKSFPAGTYPLKVMNKVGIAEAPSNFTID